MKLKKCIIKVIQKCCYINKFPKNFDPILKKNKREETIDFQINGIITLSKTLKKKPYDLSLLIAKYLKKEKMFKNVYTHTTGFINLSLKEEWICEKIKKMISSKKLDISLVKNKKTIVIDYSSPNLAKEMHVGHLRSTILGDSTARILNFLGHKIIRVNHVGDIGTPFGMILYGLKKSKNKNENLEEIYKKSQKKYKNKKYFSKKVEEYVLKLQKKDPEIIKKWKKIISSSISKNQKIYKKLNIKLKKSEIFGESFYQPMIPNIIHDLKKKNIIKNVNGTSIIFLKNEKNRKGEKMGVIIQKKNGAFLYITTDIACIKYRIDVLKAQKIIYYTDIRQKQHIEQVYKIAKMSGYIPKNVIIEHHYFGMILSKNNKPFRTREGDTIKLSKLLKESISRVKNKIFKKNKQFPTQEIDSISSIIGIGAIKYYDLSKNRIKNYIFDWNQILSLSGNTILYIQYAYTRIYSILKKKKSFNFLKEKNNIFIFKIIEKKIMIHMLQFEEIIYKSGETGKPHLICKYLYKLSELFSNFYENCSILTTKNKKKETSRIKIIYLISKIIKKGLNLLGIKIIKKI